jgi:hypothetical protein
MAKIELIFKYKTIIEINIHINKNQFGKTVKSRGFYIISIFKLIFGMFLLKVVKSSVI